MNVLHFLATGNAAGIEVLVKEYASVSKNNNCYIFFWSGGVIAEEMKNKGYHVIELQAKKTDFFGPLHRLADIIEKQQTEVLVTHHASPAMWIFMNILKNKYKHIKTVVYAHANLRDIIRENISRGLWLRRHIFNWTYKRADCVVAISESVKKSFKDYGFKELDKINVIYNGIDISKFSRSSYEVHTPIRIAYVGRLVQQKGVRLLIEAIGKMNSQDDFVCDIVGNGPEKESLELLTKELGIDKKVKFHGVRRDISDFLKQEDIFVHPATWEEGFGIALAEGMASGLLCVAFRKGAIPEIIDNNENGFIVEETSADALAKKLEHAVQCVKTGEGVQMREKAVKKAERFSLNTYVDTLDKLFDGLTN